MLVDREQVVSFSARFGESLLEEFIERLQIFEPPILSGSHLTEILPEFDEPLIALMLLRRLPAQNLIDLPENDKGPPSVEFGSTTVLGQWCRSICGIGPVITAGLLAHIDNQAPTAGHIWNFAGLNPNVTWGKGQKRPWNAKQKVLAWKIGESFLKTSGRDKDVYGHVLMERKALETEKNERGDHKDQALAMAAQFPTHAQIAIYKQGKLPAGCSSTS
jgi:hypothetical protein